MYCHECKVNYKGDFKYCVTCNEELLSGKICSHCSTVNSEHAKMCNLCGEFLEDDIKKTVSSGHENLNKTFKECVKCRSHFDNSKIYCENCGSDLILKTGVGFETNFEKTSFFKKALGFFKIY